MYILLGEAAPIEMFSNLPWILDPVPKDDVSGKYLRGGHWNWDY